MLALSLLEDAVEELGAELVYFYNRHSWVNRDFLKGHLSCHKVEVM